MILSVVPSKLGLHTGDEGVTKNAVSVKKENSKLYAEFVLKKIKSENKLLIAIA